MEHLDALPLARRRLQGTPFDVVALAVDESTPGIEDVVSELRLIAAGSPRIAALCDGPEQVPATAPFDLVIQHSRDTEHLTAALEGLRGPETPDVPPNDWPQPLGEKTATSIRAALDRGDIDSLLALAESLKDQPDAPAADVETLMHAARHFNLETLRQLAMRCGGGPTRDPSTH
jgi:hypothetical protein